MPAGCGKQPSPPPGTSGVIPEHWPRQCWVTTMTSEAYKEPMLRSVVCACVLVIGGGVVAGCGGSSSRPRPPSMASLARTFIQHGHPLPPSHSHLVHYGWHLDPSGSHCTAREDTQTLGEG